MTVCALTGSIHPIYFPAIRLTVPFRRRRAQAGPQARGSRHRRTDLSSQPFRCVHLGRRPGHGCRSARGPGPPMIIDAHHHLWDPGVRRHAWLDALPSLCRPFGPDDFAPLATAHGVTASVLVQVLPSVAETGEFLAVAAAGTVVAGVVGWADLTAPGVADQIARLRELPRRGPAGRPPAPGPGRAGSGVAGPAGRASRPARPGRRRAGL